MTCALQTPTCFIPRGLLCEDQLNLIEVGACRDRENRYVAALLVGQGLGTDLEELGAMPFQTGPGLQAGQLWGFARDVSIDSNGGSAACRYRFDHRRRACLAVASREEPGAAAKKGELVYPDGSLWSEGADRLELRPLGVDFLAEGKNDGV